ncbi:MotA/TolQ/ExbB proton channel family protein [Comamonas terrigena]|uniref:MotA/TolQ/ExbB proton channel family protein n=1 Tax=Comamonas terrigena TaxID=32013 RepID=UPI00244D5638|nr:MotA/TolQ/ExbB proton channel family protein [Comamonas terrigena]MDH1703514.1 MotA/TolQ/ExbB proton channel family protein [Comamonas terrigena]
MDARWQWLAQGDAVTRGTAALLLAMSVASWVVILVQLVGLVRRRRQAPQAMGAFWQAADLPFARVLLEKQGPWLLPLVQAVQAARTEASAEATLAGQSAQEDRLMRHLRVALQQVGARLQWGQTMLASISALAPFVGLLGTVWGIHHALAALTGVQQVSLDQLAGPVGEALVMTAAGLAVAIPAALAYNLFGRSIALLDEALDGFAHDLHAHFAGRR